MSENRKQVLEMLAAGQITAEEAERLIAALEKGPTASAGDTASTAKSKPKYLRVVVEEDEKCAGKGPTKVNVRIPLQLLRAGVKLAGIVPESAQGKVQIALGRHGIPLDMSKLNPDNLEELVEHLSDLTVDVDDKNGQERVRVFCE